MYTAEIGDNDAQSSKSLYTNLPFVNDKTDSSKSNPLLRNMSTSFMRNILENDDGDVLETIGEDNDEQPPSFGFSDYLKIGKSDQLAKISDNFFIAAALFGKVIISEEHLSIADKQIKPFNAGGVAGGEKFAVHNIFFKYPVDKCNDGVWLYGGNEASQEYSSNAANHDLKGLTHFMMADKDNFFDFPLIATIDYQGYRLTAMEKLNISDKTLMYGSSNAGKTVTTDKDLHERLVNIAKELNLLPHIVGNTEVALCGDLEIHKRGDKYFVLDLARIFPPMLPGPEDPIQSVFFRMFRPEFVKQYNTPLVSDALTGWVSNDPSAKNYNREISIATKELLNQIIPNFAKLLCTNIDHVNHKFIATSQESINQPEFTPMSVPEPLITALHSHGINIRYLGLVRHYVHLNEKKKNKGNPAMASFLLDLILTRVLKNYWRAEIRKNFEKTTKVKDQSASIQQSSLEISVSILNSLLDGTKNTDFWEELVRKIHLSFGKISLLEAEVSNLDSKMKQNKTQCWIIIRFCQLVGILLKGNTIHLLNSGKQFELTAMDIDFVPKIKCPPLLDYHSGRHNLQQASESDTVLGKLGFLKHAKIRLARSYASSPTNTDFSYYFALSIFQSHTLGPSDKCDLQFVTEQFIMYLDHTKNNIKQEKEHMEAILRLIGVVMWQLTDKLLHENHLHLLIRKFAPNHESYFTKETVYKIWKEFPDVYKRCLCQIMFWRKGEKYNKVLECMFSLFPVNEDIDSCLVLAQSYSYVPHKQVAYYKQAKEINNELFQDYITKFLKKVESGTYKGDWYLKCAQSICKADQQSKEILYALFYLYDDCSQRPRVILKGWSRKCEEKTYTGWFYIQKLVMMDGINFIDKYITYCEELVNMKSFENSAHCFETLLYTILSNPDLIAVYQKKKNLNTLFHLYVHRAVRQLKILSETFDKSWFQDITYLIQLLLYSFPETYYSVSKLYNSISEVSTDYGIAILKVIADLSLNIVDADIRALYKNYDMKLKFHSINDEASFFTKIEAPRFRDDEKKAILITALPSNWIKIILQQTTLLEIVETMETKRDLVSIAKALGGMKQRNQKYIQEKKDQSLVLSHFFGYLQEASKHELQAKKLLEEDVTHDFKELLQLAIAVEDLGILEDYIRKYPLSDELLSELICYSITTSAPDRIIFLLLQSNLSESYVDKVWETVFSIKNVEIAKILMEHELLAKYLSKIPGEHPILDDSDFMKCFIGHINHLTSDLNWLKNRVPQLSWGSQVEVYTSLNDPVLIVQLNHPHPMHSVETNFSDHYCNVCKETGTSFYQCSTCNYEICNNCSRSSLISKVISEKKYGVLFEMIRTGYYFNVGNYISVIVHGKEIAGPPAVCAVCVDIQWLSVFKDDPMLYSYAADVEDIPYTALHFLAKCGNESAVEHLLEKGWPVDISSSAVTETTPLQLAVQEGHVDVVNLLITKGANIDVLDEDDRNLLHLAAKEHQIPIVALLLEKKSDVNAKDGSLRSPLIHAAEEPTGELVRILLENKADINADKEIALRNAASKCVLKNIQHLLNAGASFNTSHVDHMRRTVLHHALIERYCKNRLEVVTILLEHGFPVTNEDSEKMTPIQYGIKLGDVEIFSLLLKYIHHPNYDELLNFAKKSSSPEICQHIVEVGKIDEISLETPRVDKDPKKQDISQAEFEKLCLAIKKNINPLILYDFLRKHEIKSEVLLNHLLIRAVKTSNISVVYYLFSIGTKLNAHNNLQILACRNGNIDLVKFLLDQNISVHTPEKSGETPLHVAVTNKHLNLVSLLLSLKCDPNSQMKINGSTPLHTAVEAGSTQIISLLLKSKSNVNTKNLYQQTPLHLAFIPSIVKMLLAAGNKVDQPDKDLYTPLHNAVTRSYPEITTLLINAKSDINAKNDEKRTPLHISCKRGDLNIVKLLVQAGCELEIKDNEGTTPLSIAVMENQFDIVTYLIKAKCNLCISDNKGETLLHKQICSVYNDHTKMLELLIKSNCDINKQNENGCTALHEATRFLCKDSIKLLLDAKCDTSLKNTEGNTALLMAIMEDNQEIISLLSEGVHKIQKERDVYSPEMVPERYYSYEELKNNPIELTENAKRLEIYLAPSEFNQVFGMTLQDFYLLEPWKRVNKKIRLGLYDKVESSGNFFRRNRK